MIRDSSSTLPRAVADTAASRPTAPAGLLEALISFEDAPGRYATVRREPRMLFDHPLEVLQLAAGREPQGFAEQAHLLMLAQRAARYFVRVVMLKPGADHYTLLGLTPEFEPTTLREHYRLLIRLAHPDFANTNDTWPADAAARINLANDVLGSAVKRREYTERLALSRAAASEAGQKSPNLRQDAVASAPVSGAARGGTGFFQWNKLGAAVGGAALMGVLLLWLNGQGDDNSSLRVREVAVQVPVDRGGELVEGMGAAMQSMLKQGPKAAGPTPETKVSPPVLRAAPERSAAPALVPQAVQTKGAASPSDPRQAGRVSAMPTPVVGLKMSPNLAEVAPPNRPEPESVRQWVEVGLKRSPKLVEVAPPNRPEPESVRKWIERANDRPAVTSPSEVDSRAVE